MAELLMFHHAPGQTPGFRRFADELRAAGRTVHTPDLYDGQTFDTLDEGIAYAKEVGFEEILERGVRAADGLPSELVYGGMSLGVMPAQKLAQTRPGVKGAVLLHATLPPSEFGGGWPSTVPVQIHFMEEDEFGLEGDIEPRASSRTRSRRQSCSSIPATGVSELLKLAKLLGRSDVAGLLQPRSREAAERPREPDHRRTQPVGRRSTTLRPERSGLTSGRALTDARADREAIAGEPG